jgi:uncharacterized protein (DUF2164 family)
MEKNKQTKKCLGVDIGFWNSKGLLLSGEGPVETCFPSLTASKYTGVIEATTPGVIPQNLNNPSMSYGDMAADFSGKIPENQTSRDWIYSELHDNLIKAVCHQVGIQNGDSVNLCISLPYTWYKDDAAEFVAHLRDVEWKIETTDGEKIEWMFEKIFVIPQDYGFYINETYGFDGQVKNPDLMHGEILLIGVGGHTAGALHLRENQQGVMMDTGHSDTFEKSGAWKVVETLREYMEREHKCEISKPEAAKTYKGTPFFHRGWHDYAETILSLNHDLFNTVVNNVKSKIDIEKVPRVMLVGGTSTVLVDFFKESFDAQEILLAQNPIIGQAAGNAKFAKIQTL